MEDIKTSAGGVEASLRRFSGCGRSKLTSLLLSFPDSLYFFAPAASQSQSVPRLRTNSATWWWEVNTAWEPVRSHREGAEQNETIGSAHSNFSKGGKGATERREEAVRNGTLDINAALHKVAQQ